MKSEILVFLFVLILTVNFSFAATTDSSQASCEDSDHGIDYIVKGSLNYKLNIYIPNLILFWYGNRFFYKALQA